MIEILFALGAGLISFLSPCVLPLIPGYIAYISGSTLNEILEKYTLIEKIYMNIIFADNYLQITARKIYQ